jgi:hypothetical protein
MALVRIQFRRSRGPHVGIIGTMYERGIAANVMYADLFNDVSSAKITCNYDTK